MTDHAHFPDYEYYRSRNKPKRLTCTQCGKPIYCTNEHLEYFRALTLIPILIALLCQSRIAFGVFLLIAIVLDEPLRRFIFPKLHFAIDYEAMRGKLNRYHR